MIYSHRSSNLRLAVPIVGLGLAIALPTFAQDNAPQPSLSIPRQAAKQDEDDFIRAESLVDEGAHAEARRLLQTAIKRTDDAAMRVAFQVLLARSYALTGEIAPARQTAEAVLAVCRLVNDEDAPTVEQQESDARDMLHHLRAWEQEPVQVEPSVLNFSAAQASEASRLADLTHSMAVSVVSVRTLSAEPLQVKSDDPRVEVKLIGQPQQQSFDTLRRLQISIPPGALEQGLNANITINNPNNPQHSAVLPLTSAPFATAKPTR